MNFITCHWDTKKRNKKQYIDFRTNDTSSENNRIDLNVTTHIYIAH